MTSKDGKLNEFAKMAFRLLDEINQAINDGSQVDKAMPDVQERIVTCVTGLHSEIRRHDDMALREHNPERYSKMCVARHIDDVDASLESFFNEVKEARLRHQIADVHLITRVIIDQDSSESPALGFAHFGAVQEAESMCAWAMGRAIEERRKFISHIGSEGTRAARK